MPELIYPKLSYDLVGMAFNVFNRLGYGYQEKYYQKAFAEELNKNKYEYQKECCALIKYEEKIIGRYLMDFVVKN